MGQGVDMDIECVRHQLADRRGLHGFVQQLGVAGGEKEPVRKLASLLVAREILPNVVSEVRRQISEAWPTAEAVKREVDKELLIPLYPNLVPLLGTRDTTDDGEGSG